MSYLPSVHAAITNSKPQARFYEGGKRTAANRDFNNASSDFENTATPDRDTLRDRARWLHENNPIMSNIDEAIVNNSVGKGVRLQSKTGKKKADDEIERRFAQWAKSCDISKMLNFYDMQRIILENRMVDGEIFIHKITTSDGLKLQLVEAHALDRSKGENGISYDKNGAPSMYHFKGQSGEAQDVDASKIINYFKKVRPTQKRGISEYKQAIIDIKNFSAYQTATIQAARARANIAYAVESDREASAFTATPRESSDYQQGDILDVNGLMVYYLRSGEELKALDTSNGGSNYGDFTRSCVRLMAVARKVSYELAFRDYSQVNFASSRASLIQDNKRFDNEQQHLTEYVLEDIFREWLELEVMLGNIKSIKRVSYLKDKLTYTVPKWSYPKREWTDPVKDLTSQQMEIDMTLTTNTDACAARGEDYEENLRTKRKELELKKEILGEYYEEVVATEQKNKELLIATLTGEEQPNENQA